MTPIIMVFGRCRPRYWLPVCVREVAVNSKPITCSICDEEMSYDAAYKVFWCESCDFPIENLSPVRPRIKRKKEE